jgi:1,3-beta-glucan synthase
MSGYPNQQEYHDGYGHGGNGTDSYYQDDHQQYYDNNGYDAHEAPHGGGQGGHQGAHDGYYDES